MSSRTLSRYFAWRFFLAVAGVFVGIFVLVALVDYVEAMRKASDVPNAPASELMLMSLYRVPQIMESLMPFSVQVGAMACFFSLSRRMELVVARGAGMSVWQIITPAIMVALAFGAVGTMVYNPISASLREASKRIESKIFGQTQTFLEGYDGGYWVRQRGTDGESILNARQSREQGLKLATITVFTFNAAGEFKERIEAQEAELQPGAWQLTHARVFALNTPPQDFDSYMLPTKLTREQVAESFAAPDTVGFWHLPTYIRFVEDSGLAAAGYRLQYQILIARPFLLAAMILLACSVSMRAFRFGGVPQRILLGVAAGFSIYVLSKVTADLSKADLLHPLLAAWLPIAAGGLSGFLVLLHEEDG
ncbi:MAG TPA: LPS export ABC transporter permease LptG [Xanthobacteraceae bacterium]|nr:LPS export ABC transporter permease LptG [Xanthobacteraceae bacterium]